MNVSKNIETSEAHATQLPQTFIYVRARIIIWYLRNAHHDVGGTSLLGHPLQVLHDLTVAPSCITFVMLRIHVLDVDKELIHHGQQPFQTLTRHVQASFECDAPLRAAQGTERRNEIGLQARLSAAECHATARCQEIEAIYGEFFVELFRRHAAPHALRLMTLVVQTVSARQRTAMECHQRGNSLTVRCQSMPINAYERSLDVHGLLFGLAVVDIVALCRCHFFFKVGNASLHQEIIP